MQIKEMQEPLDSPWPAMEKMISDITRQYKEGITKEVSYHSQLALLYSTLKDVDNTRAHAALVPDTAEVADKENVYISLARMLVYENKLDEAIIQYQKCLAISSEHEMALDEIAWCCYELKNYDEAEKWFRQSLDLEEDTNYSETWQGLGLTLSEQKKYKEAITCFSKALELEEEKVNVNYYEYMIGLCYAHENDFYRALAHYTKSLDADPRYSPSLNNIATLYYEHESDIKTAIEYLKKAEVIAEDDKDNQSLQLIYINLCRLYGQLSEYDQQEWYNAKLLSILGFMSMDDFDKDDDNDDEDYEDGDEVN